MIELSSETQPGATPIVLIGFAEAGRITSLSRSTIERLVDAGDFPEPVRVTPSRCAFVRGEVEDWVRERAARRAGRRAGSVAA